MPRPPLSRRRRRLAAALGVALALPPAAGGDTPATRKIDRLRAELELARSGAFYLRLDLAHPALELALRGAVLERYPALAVERGTARVAFRERGAPAGWDRVRYGAGRLQPARERDRIEIVAPAAGAAATPPPLPPTAEEAVSVPERWRVVFSGGLVLEVVSPGAARNRGTLRRAADAWSHWWEDRMRAAAPDARERVWLRVRLAPEEAAALYRGLPPDVGLVVAGTGPE